jgi:hypothetical protein
MALCLTKHWDFLHLTLLPSYHYECVVMIVFIAAVVITNFLEEHAASLFSMRDTAHFVAVLVTVYYVVSWCRRLRP